MPPMVQALPRSDSKARLLSHLGLDMRNLMHRRLYNLMKLEASEGRKRIIAHLDAQARRDSSQDTNQTSYSTSQIDEAVMDAEVRTIYETAQQATRSLYDLATDYNMPDRPNWIIRWMLWHVFRYRDGRQQSTNRSSSRDVASDEEVGSTISANAVTSITRRPEVSIPSMPIASAPPIRYRYFDPVREQYRT